MNFQSPFYSHLIKFIETAITNSNLNILEFQQEKCIFIFRKSQYKKIQYIFYLKYEKQITRILAVYLYI